MRRIREILCGKWVEGQSHRELARSLEVSVGVLGATLSRAQAVGLDRSVRERASVAELESRRYRSPAGAKPGGRVLPDFAEVHAERQCKGMTLALLHAEYLEAHPGGYAEDFLSPLRALCTTACRVELDCSR